MAEVAILLPNTVHPEQVEVYVLILQSTARPKQVEDYGRGCIYSTKY